MTYPDAPGFVKGSSTSRDAAASMADVAPSLRDRVYQEIWSCEDGLTDDELEQRTRLKHQTVSARRRELVLDGFVREAGKRLARSGRKATVWVVVDPTIKEVPVHSKKRPKPPTKEEIEDFRRENLPKIRVALARREANGQKEIAVDYGPYGYLVAIQTKRNGWVTRWTDKLVKARY